MSRVINKGEFVDKIIQECYVRKKRKKGDFYYELRLEPAARNFQEPDSGERYKITYFIDEKEVGQELIGFDKGENPHQPNIQFLKLQLVISTEVSRLVSSYVISDNGTSITDIFCRIHMIPAEQ